MPITPKALIETLGLKPHPEGGCYVETWRDQPADGGRGAGTAIYFLLCGDEVSHWHRIDSAEIWHFYDGAPLELSVAMSEAGPIERLHLGRDLVGGERPQHIVPPTAWQSARSLGDWTLVGCTVSPAFSFEHFELGPPGWEPGG